jgi:hypothetical protein
MIAGAEATHVVFIVHYHLHATTSFQSNPIVPVDYLKKAATSTPFLTLGLKAS